MPPAGLRKENGKMKINYTFANREMSDVEVSEEIGTVILDSRREESNLDRCHPGAQRYGGAVKLKIKKVF